MKDFLKRVSSRKFILVVIGILIVISNYMFKRPLSDEDIKVICFLISLFVSIEGAKDFKAITPKDINDSVDSINNVIKDVEGVVSSKTISINENGRTWYREDISYEDLVRIYGLPVDNVYSITFAKGDESKPQGTLVKGESVKVKDGMYFNVFSTDNA